MTSALRDSLNRSNPNELPNACRDVLLGDALAVAPAFITGTVASNVLTLPERSRAAQILLAYVRVGGSTGLKTVVAAGSTPAAGQCAVNAAGNIAFAAADAVTSADVFYVPAAFAIYESTILVAASSGTLPFARRALTLLSATVVTGVIPGAKTPAARGSAPAATSAAISVDGTAIAFNAADVVAGTATVRYIATPGVGDVPFSTNRLLATQVGY